MPINLEIDFKGNGKMNEVFHPTLPFSYLKDKIYLGSSTGAPNEWTFATVYVQATRPFFYLAFDGPNGAGLTRGITYIRVGVKNANGYFPVSVYVRRIILFVDPQNGYVAWNAAGQELVENAYLVVGDIRG